MPKKRGNFCDRSCRECDMFGHQLGFNIDGEDVYKTETGSCWSIIIFAITIIITQFVARDIIVNDLDRPISTMTFPNKFGASNTPLQ
jgi:hypothetical protein